MQYLIMYIIIYSVWISVQLIRDINTFQDLENSTYIAVLKIAGVTEQDLTTRYMLHVANDVEEGNPVHFNGTFSPGFCDSEPY